MDLAERINVLDCDPVFRIRSQTVGDLNETGLDDNGGTLMELELELGADVYENTSPGSSYSNLSMCSQSTTCTNPIAGSGVCSPVWKPRKPTQSSNKQYLSIPSPSDLSPPMAKDTEC